MTRYSKYHLIIVILTFGLLGVLKGQVYGVQEDFDEPILIDEMTKHRQSFPPSRKVEIIPYRIVPSEHPMYGCWSELEVMWPNYIKDEYREALTITIVNQELHNDIPSYVELGGNYYFVMKLPNSEFDRRDYKDWEYERY